MAEEGITESTETGESGDRQPLVRRPEGLKPIITAAGGSRRLASLDVFRGLTIAVMILVDDAGGVYPAINHAPWDGITLADFVMPFFLFIIGVAMAIVFKRVASPRAAALKVALRAAKLCALGVALQGLASRSLLQSLAVSAHRFLLSGAGMAKELTISGEIAERVTEKVRKKRV